MLSAEERTRIAYHEGGHAIVAAALGDGDEVHRVSILDGGGLGATGIQRKEESLYTADQLYERLVATMAGLAAEELVLGQLSTGAEGDLEEATEIARDMIGRFGFSGRVGRMRLLAGDVEVYLGGESQMNDLAEETHREFDVEVRELLSRAERTALEVLRSHRTGLDALVERLLADETIEGAPLAAMLAEVAPSPVSFEQRSHSQPE
jgi:cell division protease FtsH